MPMPWTPLAREKGIASLLNSVFIGCTIGTFSVIGTGGAQAITNMAGDHVGREFLAYAKAQGTETDSVPELIGFLLNSTVR